jgi:ankyrin repeat protein
MGRPRRLHRALLLAMCVAWTVATFPLGFPQTPSGTKSPSVQGSSTDLLQTAVRNGNAQEVERLLASGADPNATDPRGNAPLLQAAWTGNAAIIGSLLNHGADVNRRNSETASSPLLYAVLSGREAVVRLLLDRGARVDFRYRENQTILHIAAASGNVPILEALLAASADVNAADERDRTALDEAVLHDQLPAVLLMAHHGGAVRRVHPLDGRGPLHEACVKGFSNLIQPLIEAGADPVRPDRFGLTPLDLALDYKNENTVTALLHLNPPPDALRQTAGAAMESAALRGQTEIAKLLLRAGLPINERTPAGSTYLSDAALKGRKQLVQLLLEQGADVNEGNPAGGTPLHDAALGGNPEVIRLLLDHGARVDAQDQESRATPLMIAASLGRSSAVALLLHRGANPNLKDRFGHTALDRARQIDDDATIRLLEAAIGARTEPAPAKDGC